MLPYSVLVRPGALEQETCIHRDLKVHLGISAVQ
jgi:hypothetical protein